MTPFGKLPYLLYSKIISEETPISKFYEFLYLEYKKLTDKAKVNVLNEKDIERVEIHAVLGLYRFGGILQGV